MCDFCKDYEELVETRRKMEADHPKRAEAIKSVFVVSPQRYDTKGGNWFDTHGSGKRYEIVFCPVCGRKLNG